MVISTALIGTKIDAVKHYVDERWTMAYAAALDDHTPVYFDTTQPDGIVAHPVFGVCPEWPVIVASRDQSVERGVSPAEVLTSVHATHDTTIHRLIRPGDHLTTSLETVGMVQIKPGAMSTTRLVTVDASGHPVTTSTQSGIYLAQTAVGEQQPDPNPPAELVVARIGSPVEVMVPVAAGAAHTYTECARIWNPIHTDKAVALASGLPDVILHGTANLAHGVTAVLNTHGDRRPELVRRIRCRFAAMVRMPSTMTVRIWSPVQHEHGQQAVPFEVLNAENEPAVKDGVVLLGEPTTG